MWMLLNKLLQKVEKYFYKKNFEKKVGHPCKNLKVLGKVYFENCTIEVGENVTLWPGVTFSGNGLIRLGNDVKVGQNTILYANKNGGLEVGDSTMIAAQSYIIDTNHSTKKDSLMQTQALVSKKIEIGKDVWIGANCVVLMGSKIGDGSVVGANSLVNGNIPSYKIAFGSPARVYKDRE